MAHHVQAILAAMQPPEGCARGRISPPRRMSPSPCWRSVSDSSLQSPTGRFSGKKLEERVDDTASILRGVIGGAHRLLAEGSPRRSPSYMEELSAADVRADDEVRGMLEERNDRLATSSEVIIKSELSHHWKLRRLHGVAARVPGLLSEVKLLREEVARARRGLPEDIREDLKQIEGLRRAMAQEQLARTEDEANARQRLREALEALKNGGFPNDDLVRFMAAALDSAVGVVFRTENERARLMSEVVRSRCEIEALRAAGMRLKEQLEQQSKKQPAEAEEVHAPSLHDSLADDLASERREKEEALEALQQAREALEAAERGHLACRGELEECQERARQLERRAAGLQEEAAATQQRLADREKEVGALRATGTAQETAVKEALDRVRACHEREVEALEEGHRKALEALQRRLDQTREQHDAERSQWESDREKAVGSTERKITEAIKAAEAATAESERRVQEAVADKEEMQAALRTAHQRVARLEEEKEAAEKRLGAEKGAAEEALQTVTDLKGQIEKMRAELEAAVGERDEAKSAMHAERLRAEEEGVELEQISEHVLRVEKQNDELSQALVDKDKELQMAHEALAAMGEKASRMEEVARQAIAEAKSHHLRTPTALHDPDDTSPHRTPTFDVQKRLAELEASRTADDHLTTHMELQTAEHRLAETEHLLDEELARNKRLEKRLEWCMDRLRSVELQRIAQKHSEKKEKEKEEKDRGGRQQKIHDLQSRIEQQCKSGSPSRTNARAEAVGWLLARGALVRDVCHLHTLLTGTTHPSRPRSSSPRVLSVHPMDSPRLSPHRSPPPRISPPPPLSPGCPDAPSSPIELDAPDSYHTDW